MSRPSMRRLLLVDRPFQLGLAAFFFALQVVLLGIFSYFVHLFLRSELDANLLSARVVYKDLGEQLMPIVLTLGLLDSVLAAVAITVFVVVRTHRIAGPLYRVKTVLDALRERQLSPMTTTRTGDQLGALSDSVRALVDVLQQDHERLTAEVNALSQAVKEGAGPDKLQPLVEALRTTASAWKR